jgi:hypothetical protein
MDVVGILDKIVSHALELGLFESVNSHEPKSQPGNGLTAAVWVQTMGPVPSSGLDSTSAKIVFTLRIYQNMLQEPQDAIDPNVIAAADTLLATYSGDFTLGGLTREVDLLGEHGDSLSVRAGYLNVGNTLYRVMDVTLPLIINDVWEQVA